MIRFRLIGPMTCLFVCISLTMFAADPPGIPDGWSDGYVYANGIRIHYYHAVPAPGKPVMVMVHGVTDIGLSWTTLTWELQQDYDIYMLDARGHGLSDPFTPTDNEETLIKDVVEFIQVMQFDKPILMGHSMGSVTVMKIGAQYPDLAKTIIMLDPPSLPRKNTQAPANRTGQRRMPPQTQRPVDLLPVNMSGDPETLVKQNNYSFEDLVNKGLKDNPKWDIVDIKYWALSKQQYHGAYSESGALALRGSLELGNALAEITVPSIILKADTSPQGRIRNEEAVADIKMVKLVHIDDSGHNLHHDQLEQTVRVINEFLSTVL